MHRNGKTSLITRNSPNEIITHSGYAEVVLLDKDHEESGRVLVSLTNVEKIESHKWRLHISGYACTNIGTKVVLMHRLILDAPTEMLVDHRNHNSLDNRDDNLRLCTSSQNQMNKCLATTNTSGKTGVSYNQRTKKWTAQLRKDKKSVFSGYYETKSDAIDARVNAEKEHYGEFMYGGEVIGVYSNARNII